MKARWSRRQASRFGAAVAETGAPADAILEAARNGVELIVMSTHGLGRSGCYALGSVAMKVLMGAECPVLLLRSRQ